MRVKVKKVGHTAHRKRIQQLAVNLAGSGCVWLVWLGGLRAALREEKA